MKFAIIMIIFLKSLVSYAEEVNLDLKIREARMLEQDDNLKESFSIYNQLYDDCLSGKIFCSGSSKLFLAQKAKRNLVEMAPINSIAQTSTQSPEFSKSNQNKYLTWGLVGVIGAVTFKYLKDNQYEIEVGNYIIEF